MEKRIGGGGAGGREKGVKGAMSHACSELDPSHGVCTSSTVMLARNRNYHS